jgi:transposase
MIGMSKSRYPIRLSQSERSFLQDVCDGSYPKTKRRRAAILMRADENRADGGLSDQQIANALECSYAGIKLVRKKAFEKGLLVCIEGEYSNRPCVRKITGDVEAQLITLCCSEPPEGHARWTLRLLAGRLVELEIVDCVDHSTLHHCLKKMNLNLGAKNSGA